MRASSSSRSPAARRSRCAARSRRSASRYEAIDIAPRDRSQPPAFAAREPVAQRAGPARRRGRGLRDRRVPALSRRALSRGGARAAARRPGARRATCAGSSGLPTRSGRCGSASWRRSSSPRSRSPACAPRVSRISRAWATYLEAELEGGTWCLGERYSVADIYLYMLVGWQHYKPGLAGRRRRGAGALRARGRAPRDRPRTRARRPRRAVAPPPSRAARRQAGWTHPPSSSRRVF